MADGVLDAIIVGGGPAGLTAGIYLARARMQSILVEKQGPGGSPALTEKIENYPGFPDGISGFELVDRMRRQAENFGLEIAAFNPVTGIREEGGVKVVSTEDGELKSLGVVVATGMRPAPLGVPGEEEFLGKGVSYCATCDGAFFREATVAVIGGGNSAAEEALFLTRFANRIIIVHRRDRLRAGKILQERVLSHPKIEVRWNRVVKEVLGNGKVRGLVLSDVESEEEEEIAVDGVFLYVGNIPNTDAVRGLIELDEKGYVITDASLKTSVDGIYAAGDVRAGAIRQVVVAVGEGARAGMAVQAHVDELKGTAYK
jgi:thioredoxin reductase (NADPH)